MGRWLLVGLAMTWVTAVTAAPREAQQTISPSVVQQGVAASPIPFYRLKLVGKIPAQVALGSYLVNGAADCSGCHSFPRFLPQGDAAGGNPAAGDPYQGIPSSQSISQQLRANFNVSHYLAGGRCFGPFMARNLTPDASGRPLGLTEIEFFRVMRTGEDVACEKNPLDPVCALGPDTAVLQTMSWPTYHSMTDADISAIYAYLSALPAAQACNTVVDGCPGYSGAATGSTTYAYPNTNDCPNPPPPQ